MQSPDTSSLNYLPGLQWTFLVTIFMFVLFWGYTQGCSEITLAFSIPELFRLCVYVWMVEIQARDNIWDTRDHICGYIHIQGKSPTHYTLSPAPSSVNLGLERMVFKVCRYCSVSDLTL